MFQAFIPGWKSYLHKHQDGSTSIRVLLSTAQTSHVHLAMSTTQLQTYFLGFSVILKFLKEKINPKSCVMSLIRWGQLLASSFSSPKGFCTLARLLYTTVAFVSYEVLLSSRIWGICFCPQQEVSLLVITCWRRVYQGSLHQ